MAAAPPPPPDWANRQQIAGAEIGPPAGFWIRFVAYVIDALVLCVPIFIGGIVLYAIFADSWEDEAAVSSIVGGAALLFLALIVIAWLYEALLTSGRRGATLGKQAVGVRIVAAGGAQLSFGRATARYFLKAMITPLVPFAIGYLLAAFTSRKRALHDFMADTFVIRSAGDFQGETIMASVPNSGPAAPPPPVWDARPPSPATTGYGGFWIRVVAYIIDAILLSVASGIVGAALGVNIFVSDWSNYDPTANLVSLVISWLYFALLESSERGATVGKMAVGLRVVTSDGQRLSFMNATGRYFAKFISAIILGIGFIMVAFTDKKRGLHDMIAGTLVIKVR